MKDWPDCDLLDLLHGGASAGPLSQDPEVIYRRAQCAALARLLERIPEGTTARAKPTLEAVGSALQTTLEPFCTRCKGTGKEPKKEAP